MNKLTDEQIMKMLKNVYLTAQSIYRKPKILGAFVYGPANYGYANTYQDLCIQVVYIPSVDQMCLSTDCMDKKIIIRENQYVKASIRDFRYINFLSTHHNTAIEALFTKYIIVNERYLQQFNEIKSHREEIAYFNKNRKIISASKEALERINKLLITPVDLLKQETQAAIAVARMWVLLGKYITNQPFENLIKIKDTIYLNYISTLQQRKLDSTDISLFEEWRDDFYKFMSGIKSEEERICAPLKDFVLNVVKASAASESQADIFFLKTTETEKKALAAVIKMIGKQGIVSISKLIEMTSFSRPVFNNLLAKMEQMNVAEIKSQGVKGTYIKITDQFVLDKYIKNTEN